MIQTSFLNYIYHHLKAIQTRRGAVKVPSTSNRHAVVISWFLFPSISCIVCLNWILTMVMYKYTDGTFLEQYANSLPALKSKNRRGVTSSTRSRGKSFVLLLLYCFHVLWKFILFCCIVVVLNIMKEWLNNYLVQARVNARPRVLTQWLKCKVHVTNKSESAVLLVSTITCTPRNWPTLRDSFGFSESCYVFFYSMLAKSFKFWECMSP